MPGKGERFCMVGYVLFFRFQMYARFWENQRVLLLRFLFKTMVGTSVMPGTSLFFNPAFIKR